MNIFDKIVFYLDRTEVSFVTLLAKIIPLLVPIIPAYVGYSHVTNKVTGLAFEPWAGWVYGAVIEGLGYAAIYKAVQFWEHNRKYTAEKNQAPLQAAVVIYIVYLAVTMVVNVVLDWKSGLVLYKVLAIALISLLSVPAGLLMSISAIHTERLTERERQNEQNRQRRNEQRTNNERTANERPNVSQIRVQKLPQRTNVPMPTNEQPMGFPTGDKRARLFEYIAKLQANGEQVPGPSELGRRLQMSKGYISDELRRQS